jgi:hypothetical protein
MMTAIRRLPLLFALLASPWMLGGCDFGEDRPFNYQKGNYLGKPHAPLDATTLKALQARALQQSGPSLGGTAGGGMPASVRPPDDGPGAARQRAAFQSSQGAAGDPRASSRGAGASPDALRQRAGRQRGF